MSWHDKQPTCLTQHNQKQLGVNCSHTHLKPPLNGGQCPPCLVLQRLVGCTSEGHFGRQADQDTFTQDCLRTVQACLRVSFCHTALLMPLVLVVPLVPLLVVPLLPLLVCSLAAALLVTAAAA
jgi:hypothetical protein